MRYIKLLKTFKQEACETSEWRGPLYNEAMPPRMCSWNLADGLQACDLLSLLQGFLQVPHIFTQFCYYSVTKSRLTFCNPMVCGSLGSPVLHCHPELSRAEAWESDILVLTLAFTCMLGSIEQVAYPRGPIWLPMNRETYCPYLRWQLLGLQKLMAIKYLLVPVCTWVGVGSSANGGY